MAVAGAAGSGPVARPRAEAGGPLLVGLAAATVAATAWAIMAANWTDGTGVALATAVVAVVEAALVAWARSDRLLGAWTGLLLGIVVIVLLTLGAMPPDGGQGLGHVALRYTKALTGGLFSTDDWQFLVGLCAVMWLIGFWVGWVAIREGSGLLAVLPCFAALMVNVLNGPSVAHVALPETVALGLCLLLVARVSFAALERVWRAERLITLPGTRQRFTRVATRAAAAILLLGIVVPPLTTHDVSDALFRLLPGFGHGAGRSPGGAGTPLTVEYSPNVIPGGPLITDPRRVLTYTTDQSGAVYLRVAVDSVFQGGNWYPAPTSSQPAPPGPIARDRDPGRGGLPPSQLVRSVRGRISLVGPATGSQHEALFPGDPNALDVGNVASGVDGASLPVCFHRSCSSSNPGTPLLTVDEVRVTRVGPDIYPASFTASGFVSAATEAQLRSAGTDYPSWVASRYLTLSADAEGRLNLARISSLARQWTEGATNPYDMANTIEQRLRAFSYTLDPPAVPQGIWPITYFLTSSHAGYCQYFASAMGTMLRSLGIPTRLVSGYGSGVAEGTRPALRYVVTTNDAHTWVEAYFPGYGWVPFEPTPSSAYGIYAPIPRGGTESLPPGAVPSASAVPTPRPAPKEKNQPGDAVAAAGQGAVPRALLIAGLVLLGATAAGFLGWGWMRRPRGASGVWRRLRVLGRAFGVRQRAAETDAAYARRLAAALPEKRTQAAEALDVIAALRGKARFSVEGLLPDEVTRCRDAWRRMCSLTPRLLWQRLSRTRQGIPSPAARARALPAGPRRG